MEGMSGSGKMFRSVLIANRGEIACRIAATLRELGARSVAVYSEADRDALHTRLADEAWCIGPAEPRQSYLDVGALLEAARKGGVEAVHPGYGFLAENADFAAAVEAAGFTFIGPTPDQIRTLGDKRAARDVARRAGVPIVPGAEAADIEALAREAEKLGYPVMVKAALGGGGKGMRVVGDAVALAEAVESARRVAAAAFGDGTVYLEKRIENARHVEVQVLGDGRGGAMHLFERECSLQRRHQKVVEECPSPAVDTSLRAKMTEAATALCGAVKYRGAGTVEFLLGRDRSFYFLEMNTRLQVEHPVTELVTGIDLVRAQLEIGAGLPPSFDPSSLVPRGHAIEARVYAEDPAAGFLPQSGDIVRLRWPHGPFLRVDRGVESGDTVTVHYDPLLAKIVAFGRDRRLALERLTSALDEARIHGVVTNLPFLRALLRAEAVQRAAVDTEWIEREFLEGFAAMVRAPAPELALAAAAVAEAMGLDRPDRTDAPAAPKSALDPFTTGGRWRAAGLD
jgi:acetyl/propionyl-CoA carboxylase alpha subunit